MSVDRWVRDRLPTPSVHLDVAACGRVSTAVLDAQVAHLRAEAGLGGYVAEDAAATQLAGARRALSGLLCGADVAWSEGAGAAFVTLLQAWPLPPRSRVGTVGSEYAPNAYVLRRQAALRGWDVVQLPVDDLGRVTDVPAGLDLLALPQIASQRGIVQPDLSGCGIPVVLDVAQSLGQTPVPTGCAAYVGTSRKWLCGPRGIGFLAVDPAYELDLPVAPLPGATGAAHLDVHEAHVAGRVGLAVALDEWTPELLPVVHGIAAQLRTQLSDLPGWTVVEPVDEPTGITTLVGGDPAPLRARLLAEGFITTPVPTTRSADMDRPALRISTAAWVTPDDVERLRTALGSAA
ncbi:MAG: aminotransferase class V-fold PLP-dependent enzyme [Mycobacteriales bacterium]